jgi:hypothetical protein
VGPFEFNVAQRRLAVALGFSALLHAWLMESHYGKGAARRHAGDASIAARILPAAAPASGAPSDQTMPDLDERPAPVLRAAAAAPVSNLPQGAIATSRAMQMRHATGTDTAQLQPSDKPVVCGGHRARHRVDRRNGRGECGARCARRAERRWRGQRH